MSNLKRSDYKLFDYDLNERVLPARYTDQYTISTRDGADLENSSLENAEIIPVAKYINGEKQLNPLFTFDRNAIHFGNDEYSDYVNANGLELLYDVRFGYDGYAFEIIYQSSCNIQLLVDEGDGWKMVFDKYHADRKEDKLVAIRIAFEDNLSETSCQSPKMRRFILRTTGWFGGIIREKKYSVVKSIGKKRPLAVFEGTSITECCNNVCGFNAYSYSRILSDIFGFEYLCLAQGGTGICRPKYERPSMLERIDGVIKAKPDILFMEVGINDEPDEAFKNAVDEYLKTIRKELPDTFPIMIGRYSPQYDLENPPSHEIDEINGEVCAKYGLHFISFLAGKVYGTNGEVIADMGAPLITGTGTTFDPKFDGTADQYTGRPTVNDGCHCNSKAYRMIAEYLRSAFNAIIEDM